MDKKDYEIMKEKIEKYENTQKNLKSLQVAKNDFINNSPTYVENREWGYKFTTREALSKLRMSVMECIDIEFENLEEELEEI